MTEPYARCLYTEIQVLIKKLGPLKADILEEMARKRIKETLCPYQATNKSMRDKQHPWYSYYIQRCIDCGGTKNFGNKQTCWKMVERKNKLKKLLDEDDDE